uniref:Uncharacterized protein n=1 Tax=Arundo donax TaxID=35708 RepID=A0A0A9BNP8_ARUDO
MDCAHAGPSPQKHYAWLLCGLRWL